MFTAEDFKYYDKIYAMANDVIDEMKWIAGIQFDRRKVDLLMNEIYPERDLDIPDPWYGSESGYHEVYKMIEEACDRIVAKELESAVLKVEG